MAKKATIDLTGLSMKQLDALTVQVEERKVELHEEQRQAAQEAFHSIADKYGMTPEEVLGVRRKRAPKTGAPAKQEYRNPDDPSQTWSGRGRKPGWVVAHLDGGKALEDLTTS